MDVFQLLIKKRPTRDSDGMVSRLPDSVLSPFFAMKNLHPEEFTELPQITQIILDLRGGMPLQIADDVGDLVVAFMADNGVDVIDHYDIAVESQTFILLTIFKTIQDDLEQGFVKQNRRPKMHAARDEVDIAFGSDFVSGAHRRIKILLIRVTDTYPSPSNEIFQMHKVILGRGLS